MLRAVQCMYYIPMLIGCHWLFETIVCLYRTVCGIGTNLLSNSFSSSRFKTLSSTSVFFLVSFIRKAVFLNYFIFRRSVVRTCGAGATLSNAKQLNNIYLVQFCIAVQSINQYFVPNVIGLLLFFLENHFGCYHFHVDFTLCLIIRSFSYERRWFCALVCLTQCIVRRDDLSGKVECVHYLLFVWLPATWVRSVYLLNVAKKCSTAFPNNSIRAAAIVVVIVAWHISQVPPIVDPMTFSVWRM